MLHVSGDELCVLYCSNEHVLSVAPFVISVFQQQMLNLSAALMRWNCSWLHLNSHDSAATPNPTVCTVDSIALLQHQRNTLDDQALDILSQNKINIFWRYLPFQHFVGWNLKTKYVEMCLLRCKVSVCSFFVLWHFHLQFLTLCSVAQCLRN